MVLFPPLGRRAAGPRVRYGASGVAAAGLVALATVAAAQDAIQTIETPGRAKFQICRNWLMFNSCNEYTRVDIPGRVTIGDRLFLEFGTNPKSMTFVVGAIRLADGACTLYVEPPGPDAKEDEIDKLVVTPCKTVR